MKLEFKILSLDEFNFHKASLASLLKDAVDSNASVGFVNPFTHEEALNWWTNLTPGLKSKEIILFAAFYEAELVATVQLQPATKTNALHRVEVAKLLVHSKRQGLGIGKKLMLHALEHAKVLGKSLVVLDTQSQSKAEHLYRSLGFQELGVIPDYASLPTGELTGSLFMWKKI